MDKSDDNVRGAFDPVLKEVTTADLVTFLDNAKAIPRCWLCGQHAIKPLKSQVPDPDTDHLVPGKGPAFTSLQIQHDQEAGYSVVVPAYMLSCSNCGYTFTMSATPLIEWMKQQEG